MTATPFAAVLFDLDGVLIDTETIIGALWAEIFAGHDLQFSAAEITRLTSGQRFEGVLRQLDEERGWKAPEDFLPMINERFNGAFAHVPLIAGADETLRALRAAGIPFAIASNSERNRLHLKLAGAGLAELVGEHAYDPSVVGGVGKPAPALYEYAAAQLGVPVQDCVVIEDSAPGARAGVAAGATVWGLLAGGHLVHDGRAALEGVGVTHFLSSHAQLREALGVGVPAKG
ncbi:HAD superfamily hydrolase (TIGR01509 family) [Deinococcus metalli]|uniref:Beta-phosphoglucomutase n=1 Tax=Deinococcus metalli TaxID=1141878 RepID=A0A7W8KDM1_9DEIO|nr:HAD family phosphatase [Deinococcus metalli]MBB5375128.1 HAD superfamily hydrolase (TIGR01509 family) [Deinococcus metalli]GHF31437.1 beta-phosphoglucomutase [Deinococcus metalli]